MKKSGEKSRPVQSFVLPNLGSLALLSLLLPLLSVQALAERRGASAEREAEIGHCSFMWEIRKIVSEEASRICGEGRDVSRECKTDPRRCNQVSPECLKARNERARLLTIANKQLAAPRCSGETHN